MRKIVCPHEGQKSFVSCGVVECLINPIPLRFLKAWADEPTCEFNARLEAARAHFKASLPGKDLVKTHENSC